MILVRFNAFFVAEVSHIVTLHIILYNSIGNNMYLSPFLCRCLRSPSCYPVHIYMARLPIVIIDLYHLNTSLKLPIETEPGGIRLKIVRRMGVV
ncbi:MAG: hypothetical protein KKA10_18225 [Euryarchaeota archaeon]|nr:hypothetical protein [Euryarchaeota archaeon]MCG2737516.1 hypothetical protein [Candidatus Methanoperedenaceae archaeon]